MGSNRSVFIFGWFCFLLSSAPVLLAQNEEPVEVTLSLDRQGDSPAIEVSPDPVELVIGERVEFLTDEGPGGTVIIQFDKQNGKRGPFPSSDRAENRARGRYSQNAGRAVRTAGAEEAGEWKYTVIWLLPGGERYELDPVVSVRKGP